jgi:superfamily II DNA or RNA helicase
LDRPLHKHQDQALTLGCQEGKSLLVATGTGSGKTESFLFPIADRLLRDPAPNEPGVRCLIIYPMNSLANDQLYYRIAPLFGRYLKDFGIKFGRFTSHIRANADRKEEESQLKNNDKLLNALGGKNIPVNWQLTREEMLQNPPHILITNYAMLEHLLLLPRNAPLFAQNKLQMIVLDEIHTYGGAQATEVAFLLRKLKNRLGTTSPLQVFGTSASLPEGQESDEKTCNFGSELFGEPIQHVIRGRRIPHVNLQSKDSSLFEIQAKSWSLLGQALKGMLDQGNWDHETWENEINKLKLENEIPPLDKTLHFHAALENVFAKNKEIRKTSDHLDRSGITQFEHLAGQVFEKAEPAYQTAALSALMHIGMLARAGEDSFPLLPCRYHLATNSIEGVSLSLSQSSNEGWQEIKAFRTYQDSEGRPFYPLMVCRKCGQPFFEGFECQGHLLNRFPLDNSTSRRKVFWLGSPPEFCTADENDDIEDAGEDHPKGPSRAPFRKINPLTGELDGQEGEQITIYEVLTKRDEDDIADYVQKCPACGGSTGMAEQEVITRMHPGNEAFSSVIVQKVLEALPARQTDEPCPMKGRSLLTFSDNRQDAAFFAPYFERTGSEFALRTAVYQVLKEADSEDELADLELLAQQVFKYWRKQGQPGMNIEDGRFESDRRKINDLLMGKIASEFCTPTGRRNSLEALGLVRVDYDSKLFKKLIEKIRPHVKGGKDGDTEHLARLLLETIRREKALGNLFDVDLTDKFIWGDVFSHKKAFQFIKVDPKIKHSWMPPEGNRIHNRRSWYLVEQLGWSWNDCRAFLTKFWEALDELGLLIKLNPGFGIDGTRLRFACGTDSPLYVCTSCGLTQINVVDGRCSAFRCKGRTYEYSEEERKWLIAANHYINSYMAGVAMIPRAREHTAGLSTRLREQIEQEFSEGRVNLLSCTTTMEMGVDLGELEAIVNLNIPPGISNYQQRTGRAGRRAQAAPFCVTVAKNSNYDQEAYRTFQEYLGNRAPIPFFLLDNPRLFRRHQNGIILSHFLKDRIKDLQRNAPSLADFFGESFGADSCQRFMDDVANWLESEAGKAGLAEAERLREMLPDSVPSSVGLVGPELMLHFRENLNRFALEVQEKWTLYAEKISECEKEELLAVSTDDKAKAARSKLHWLNMQKQFLGQFLVDQLSQRSLIPTYSFPVHSLTLEVTKEKEQKFGFADGDVVLNRDAALGISEYAPGAQVVANGRIWESAGLAYYPRMFMPTEYYAACPDCHHVDVGITSEDIPPACSNCGSTSHRQWHPYQQPKGFVTHYRDRSGKDPGMHRRRQRKADEARLITIPRDDMFEGTDHPAIRTVILRAIPPSNADPPGRLFVVNRGNRGSGYHICPLCNYAEPAKKRTPITLVHANPLSNKACSNTKLGRPIDLAHIFETDVYLIRFGLEIPQPDEAEQAKFHTDSFARTLVEALRFAAAKLLNIQATELRATFKIVGRSVDAILYDAIAGGAGYSVRLKQEIPMIGLLRGAMAILNCPRECSSSCSSCLCDYSNQLSWDLFDRKAVLNWLSELLDSQKTDKFLSFGCSRWEKPSLDGLSQRLEGCRKIYLYGGQALSNETIEEATWQWLINWLNQGKSADLIFSSPLELTPGKMPSELRKAFRYLYPFAKDGHLRIGTFFASDYQESNPLPRLFSGVKPGETACYSGRPNTALLGTLLVEPIYLKKIDEPLALQLQNLLTKVAYCGPEKIGEGAPIKRWALKEGENRNFKEYFSSIIGSHIENLVVKDPFCAIEGLQRNSLVNFLKKISSMAEKVEKITVFCREQNQNDKRFKPCYVVQKETSALLNEEFPSVKAFVNVYPFSARKSFHDRSLEITSVNADGCSEKIYYDLSGGIDYLMEKKRETKIYYYK